MPSLTIKNLPNVLYERLKEEAERHRRSLNSEVIAQLEQALLTTTVDPETFLGELAELHRQMTSVTPPTDALLQAAKGAGRP